MTRFVITVSAAPTTVHMKDYMVPPFHIPAVIAAPPSSVIDPSQRDGTRTPFFIFLKRCDPPRRM